MISYHIENSGFLKVIATGVTSISDWVNLLDKLGTLKGLDRSIKLLYDLSRAEPGFGCNELELIIQKAAEVTRDYESIRTAFIVDNPKQTAFIMLFTHSLLPEKNRREVFSSELAALAWLNE